MSDTKKMDTALSSKQQVEDASRASRQSRPDSHQVDARRDGVAALPHDGAAPVEGVDELVGSMVHAVSNALNSIMSASQLANLLMTQRRIGEARISLDRLEEECLRAARLLRDGRNLVVLKAPESTTGVELSTLLGVCAAACTDLGNVTVHCDRDMPRVRGQADALKRLFVEIMDNAFQFGAQNMVITASVEAGGESALIEFKDDGPGVAIHPTALFEPFVSSEPTEHCGLGLAFAGKIAAAYGGAIGAGESVDGAVFWVQLPFVSTH
ncbi:MAG TPA: HAMP domain-containing sensor histidine kinase [Rhodanobacteraceae bacterium]